MKMKKETKAEEWERSKGVLMEDLDGKLDLVLEGQEALDAKIDHNHGIFLEFAADTNLKFDVVFEELRDIRQRMSTERV